MAITCSAKQQCAIWGNITTSQKLVHHTVSVLRWSMRFGTLLQPLLLYFNFFIWRQKKKISTLINSNKNLILTKIITENWFIPTAESTTSEWALKRFIQISSSASPSAKALPSHLMFPSSTFHLKFLQDDSGASLFLRIKKNVVLCIYIGLFWLKYFFILKPGHSAALHLEKPEKTAFYKKVQWG